MLDRIRACIPALPPAEQRVARLLLADPRAFATLPVVELAERSHVSKPTVVRFCRSVGYDGLADFKLKLAGSVNEGVPFVHRAVDDDDKAGDIVVKVIDNAVAALLRYRNAAAEQSVERAIQCAGRSLPHGPPHRLLRRRQLGHRGAGRAAQVLPPGRPSDGGERWPHAGDERHHAQTRATAPWSSAIRVAAATCWTWWTSRARKVQR
jgi:hypothetical protein